MHGQQVFAFEHCSQPKKYQVKNDRLAQLAEAHQLLFYALATNYGPLRARQKAVKLVKRGCSLKDVCETIGIPFALRRLDLLDTRPALTWARVSEAKARAVMGRLPADRRERERMVEAFFYGARIGGDAFGLWLTKPDVLKSIMDLELEVIRAVALFAWFSQPTRRPLLWLVEQPFTYDMGWKTALTGARSWLNRVKFYAYFGDATITDTWAEEAVMDGYDIVALRDFWQLIDEAADMRNCLETYAERVSGDRCRLFGVRRDGVKIGTVEIAKDPTGSLRLVQFQGPNNWTPPTEAQIAVHRWIDQQPATRNARRSVRAGRTALNRFEAMLKPYMDTQEIGRAFWNRPLNFRYLDAELVRLARRANVGGWRFQRN